MASTHTLLGQVVNELPCLEAGVLNESPYKELVEGSAAMVVRGKAALEDAGVCMNGVTVAIPKP